MSHKKYQDYQAVKGSWFNQIPTHWEIQSSNRVFEQKREPAASGDKQLSVTQKYGVMPQDLFMSRDDRKVTLALAGTENFKHVEKGDFVISLRSFEGGIELSQYKGCISPAYTCLRARKPIRVGYYKFTMKSKDFISALQSVTQGIRDGKNISYAEFSKLSVPYPPVEEQEEIANFLEHETRKIDALIAEQERLIELLQEKRQAIILHAVTKGLNPDVPMKDTGVEWLGEVPEHWDVKRLKHAMQEENAIQMGPFGGLLLNLEKEDTGYKVYGQENTTNQDLSIGSRWIDEDRYHELCRYQLRQDDIILTRKGTLGNALLIRDLPQPGVADSDTIRLRPNGVTISAKYLSLTLQNATYIHEQITATKRGAILPSLSTLTIKDLAVAIPPPKEQADISNHIESLIDSSGRQLLVTENLVGLLKERRVALITAAVTGQIDVRGLASEKEAA